MVGAAYVLGGLSSAYTPMDSSLMFDPVTQAWREVPSHHSSSVAWVVAGSLTLCLCVEVAALPQPWEVTYMLASTIRHCSWPLIRVPTEGIVRSSRRGVHLRSRSPAKSLPKLTKRSI